MATRSPAGSAAMRTSERESRFWWPSPAMPKTTRAAVPSKPASITTLSNRSTPMACWRFWPLLSGKIRLSFHRIEIVLEYQGTVVVLVARRVDERDGLPLLFVRRDEHKSAGVAGYVGCMKLVEKLDRLCDDSLA